MTDTQNTPTHLIPQKNPVVAWLLWLFTGGIGGHRYYLGDIGMGVAMTLTLGGFGVWALVDAFFINRRVHARNVKLYKAYTSRGAAGGAVNA